MGALMVVDPQHTARYQPVGLCINRGAPKKGRLVRGRKTKKNPERTRTGKPLVEKKRPRTAGNKKHKDEKNPGAEGTKGRKQRAKPSFGLVSEFKHNIQIKKQNREKTIQKHRETEREKQWRGRRKQRGGTGLRRESKGRQKERTRRCLTSALITRSFVFVVKHTRPGKFILSHSAI
jgi:hypothetical protein